MRRLAIGICLAVSLLYGAPVSNGVDWSELRRPLRIPRLASGAPCPVTPARTVSRAFARAQGNGPVYPVGAAGGLRFIYPVQRSQLWYPSRWSGNKILWVARPRLNSRVLIRGRRLDGPQALRFENGSLPAAELRLELGSDDVGENGWLEYPSYTRVRAAGCYAWQVDGADFSKVIVFRAIRQR